MDRRLAVFDGAEQARAKALRPVGAFRLHSAGQRAAANDASPSLNAAPERGASTRRASMQRTLATLLTGALRTDGLSDADAAAACDRSRQHMLDMRTPGGRSITLADAVELARVSPSWRVAVVDLIGGVK